MKKLQQFMDSWTVDDLGIKPIFLSLYQGLAKMEQVKLEFHERPGISYSLRFVHEKQKDRPLFGMIDVIDDEPGRRWLSICFYGDMISDPAALGDLIPGGLLGSDGYCFDVDEADAGIETYMANRMQEAYDSACRDA